MELYRCSLSNHRLAKQLGVELIDCTVKSGIKDLAPDWSFLKTYKESKKTVDDIAIYEMLFMKKMNHVFLTNRPVFDKIARKDKVAIACYCRQDEKTFCHLELLVKCFEKYCKSYKIPFKYRGIIKK